jgi:hypothetical protein
MVYTFDSHGLKLSDAQRDECRAYACAKVLANHKTELDEAIRHHEAIMIKMLKMGLRKAETTTGETIDEA